MIKAGKFEVGDHSVIGSMVRITAHSFVMAARGKIMTSSVVAGDASSPQSSFRMGMNSWVFQNCYIDVTRSVCLGKNVGLGGRSMIFTHGYWLSKLDGFPVDYGPVSIGDNVWFPWDCFVLPNVEVGSATVFGARSLVNRPIPSNCLAVGQPAKPVGACGRFTPLPQDAVVDELFAITSECARRQQLSLKGDRSATTWELVSSRKVVLRIHVAGDGRHRRAVGEDGFHILFEKGYWPSAGAWWNQSDSASCPYDSMPRLVKLWFETARLWGVRFYPIDEIGKYGGE